MSSVTDITYRKMNAFIFYHRATEKILNFHLVIGVTNPSVSSVTDITYRKMNAFIFYHRATEKILNVHLVIGVKNKPLCVLSDSVVHFT